ncbi:protein patched homolog 1 [Caerostris extrusa]|uniref:Protein patched homolog 1 n=1 Tax=Caerostris extrusa TaxID=172846 RepID=A0AAV4RN83_CAEEX|nr:protein patched homolog 1 [Caerostris extrusa]
MPFFLDDMNTTEDILETIKEVRAIFICHCSIPFLLRLWVFSVLLLNPWAAILEVIIILMIVVELFGFMGIMGIKLNAVTTVIIIAALGLIINFSVHFLMGFLTNIGDRQHRMTMALQQIFCPVLYGVSLYFVGVITLAFSEFDFISWYFFTMLCAIGIIGLFNGFIVFPVLLSIIGPSGDVVPFDDPERIPTPSPEPSPIRQRVKHARPFTRRIYPRVPSEISLSTITEESTSRHSPEIVVEPELVLETTTVTNTTTGASTVNTTTSTPDNPDCQSEDGTTTVTTTVKATAKVKVEVHAPYSNNSDVIRHKKKTG